MVNALQPVPQHKHTEEKIGRNNLAGFPSSLRKENEVSTQFEETTHTLASPEPSQTKQGRKGPQIITNTRVIWLSQTFFLERERPFDDIFSFFLFSGTTKTTLRFRSVEPVLGNQNDIHKPNQTNYAFCMIWKKQLLLPSTLQHAPWNNRIESVKRLSSFKALRNPYNWNFVEE